MLVPPFVNGDFDTFLAVDTGDDRTFFMPPGYECYIFEANHRATFVIDHDAPHVGGALELIDGADQVLGLPVLEPAPGQVDVLLGES